MAKQYQQRDSGLMVPDWMPDMRDRRRVESSRGLIFTPGARLCHCDHLCPGCSGEAPSQIIAKITGIENQDCDDCLPINDTYVLDLGTYEYFCGWYYTFSPIVCENDLALWSLKYFIVFAFDDNEVEAYLTDKNSSVLTSFKATRPDLSCTFTDLTLTRHTGPWGSRWNDNACLAANASVVLNNV